MSEQAANNHGAFIWSVAELLRGVYKQSEYGWVILPLTVLRRLDCVLEKINRVRRAVAHGNSSRGATRTNLGSVGVPVRVSWPS